MPVNNIGVHEHVLCGLLKQLWMAHGWQGGFDGGMASYGSDTYSELVKNIQLVLPRVVPITEDGCINLEYVLATNVNKIVPRDTPLHLTEDDSAKESVSLLLQLVSLLFSHLNESLAVVLGKTLTEIEKTSAKHNLACQDFATALAISFFVNELVDEKEAWDLIVIKARKWLTKTVEPENVDTIIKTASAVLGAKEHIRLPLQ